MNDGNGLVAFLKARLDEDEQAARAAVGFDYGVREWADDGDPVNVHIARHDPARVLREVEAKRRMLEAHSRPHHCAHLTGRGASSVVDGKPWVFYEEAHTQDTGDICDVLRLLALPYADHKDYREEWRP
jgi:hypothetical protein